MIFKWVNITNVKPEIIHKFDSGNLKYNEWLTDYSEHWQSDGEMVTYVAVDEDEYNNNTISTIYAYSSISATGLMMDDDDGTEYLSCCEIRLFAIHKGLRGALDENFIPYSVNLFKLFLQDLWEMSTSVIGFKAVYLNSNDTGFHLYTDDSVGFMKPNGYVPATKESALDIANCTPLLFFLDEDGIYKLFE